MKRSIKTQTGDLFFNKKKEICFVTKVFSATKVEVIFEDNTIAVFTQQCLEKGNFKNKNTPNIYGVGYIGYGEYNYKLNKNCYVIWQSMLQRCYDESLLQRRPTYRGCTVSDKWKNFQNFCVWWYSQPNINKTDCKLQLDKDLLIKGNKIYSEEFCTLLPAEINSLLTTNVSLRGELPLGVIWHKRDNEYRARMTVRENGIRKNITICSSDSIITCFNAYKTEKEIRFKAMAEKFKNSLTKEAYAALINRKVDITD